MIEELKDILLKIINSGFEAYIVGGYVRDYILGKKTNDIDICTNALPKDLTTIFADENVKVSAYGSIKIVDNKYNIDITTYRKELKYTEGKPTEIEYIKDLETDIKRRDFTINALYMDKDGNIIDKVGGLEDLKNKVIKVIGNIEDKFSEDPLRILRALRLKITLGFSLDDDIIEYIHNNKERLALISTTRKKEEINKMLVSPNVVEGFKYLQDLQILEILGIKYQNLQYSDDINAMYAQLDIPEDFPLTKEEKDNIRQIKEILDYGKIDVGILFNYGLYLAMVAGDLLGLDKKKISEDHQALPLKNEQDLNINGDEILDILKIEPSKIVKDIEEHLILLILNGKLGNEKEILKQYINENKGLWL